MLSLSLIFALILDRMLPSLQQLRREYPLSKYTDWLMRQSFIKQVPARLLPVIMVIPVLLLVFLLNTLFEKALFGLFTFTFYSFIAFICLEPWVLNEEVDHAIGGEHSTEGRNDLIDRLFFQSNRSLYSVIFWMVVAGPVVLVIYRLLEKLNNCSQLPHHAVWTNTVDCLIAWLEWLPALISGYLFMICGNFEAGFRSSRPLGFFATCPQSVNRIRLQQIGIASSQGDNLDCDQPEIELLKRCRGLLLRSLVVWLLLALLFDYWI